MTTIIAGRFIKQDDAAAAVAQLVASGFGRNEVTSFFVNPAGQHDCYSIGGDEDESPGTRHAGTGAAAGAASGGGVGIVVAMATLPALGPAAPAAGAAIGAYVGALMGALDNMKAKDAKGNGSALSATDKLAGEPRKAGMLVAVAVPDTERCTTAAAELRAAGAAELEHAEGTIRHGEWIDFDPLLPVTPLRA